MSMSTEELEQEGFKVVDAIEFGDVSKVPDSDTARPLYPPAKGIIFTVSKPKIREIEDKETKRVKLKFLSLGLQIRDGIDADGKLKGALMFKDIMIWADSSYWPDADWCNKDKIAGNIVGFAKAVGADTANLRIDEEFLASINGKEVVGDIIQKKSKMEGVEFENDVRRFRALEVSQQV